MKSLTKTLAQISLVGALALGSGCGSKQLINFNGTIDQEKVQFVETQVFSFFLTHSYSVLLEVEAKNGDKYCYSGEGRRTPTVTKLTEVIGNNTNFYSGKLPEDIQKRFLEYRGKILNLAIDRIQSSSNFEGETQ